MKKLTALLLIVFTVASLCACTYVELNADITVNARFINEDNSVDAPLSAEDAAVISKLFNGKALYEETPPCSFTADFALTIGGSTYCIANDGCPFVYLLEKEEYFLLSNEEHEKLKELMAEYGVVFESSELSEIK